MNAIMSQSVQSHTPTFTAPERLQRSTAKQDIRACDVYSLGITFWQVLHNGIAPCEAKWYRFNNANEFKKQVRKGLRPAFSDEVMTAAAASPRLHALIELIRNMWHHNPADRKDIGGVREVLEHITSMADEKPAKRPRLEVAAAAAASAAAGRGDAGSHRRDTVATGKEAAASSSSAAVLNQQRTRVAKSTVRKSDAAAAGAAPANGPAGPLDVHACVAILDAAAHKVTTAASAKAEWIQCERALNALLLGVSEGCADETPLWISIMNSVIAFLQRLQTPRNGASCDAALAARLQSACFRMLCFVACEANYSELIPCCLHALRTENTASSTSSSGLSSLLHAIATDVKELDTKTEQERYVEALLNAGALEGCAVTLERIYAGDMATIPALRGVFSLLAVLLRFSKRVTTLERIVPKLAVGSKSAEQQLALSKGHVQGALRLLHVHMAKGDYQGNWLSVSPSFSWDARTDG